MERTAAQAAKERFQWLLDVAASRGITAMVGTFPAQTGWMGCGAGLDGRKMVCVNLGEALKPWVDWLGEQREADAGVCRWTVAAWTLLHELGHAELGHGSPNGDEAQWERDANEFARRVLSRLDPRMTIDEAGALLARVASELTRRGSYRNRMANWAQSTKAQVDDLTSASRTGAVNGQGLRTLRTSFEGV